MTPEVVTPGRRPGSRSMLDKLTFMANTKFLAAVKKAKQLYKTGRFKTFAAAVKSAYKKVKVPKKKAAGKISSVVTKSKKHTDYNKPVVNIQIGSLKTRVKNKLARALLDYELATTIKATKAAAKRKIRYRKQLRSL